MKQMFLMILIIVFSGCYCQRRNCDGTALLIPRHTYIPLYNHINGSSIDSIINDTINEDSVGICIKKIKRGYAKIIYRNVLIDTIPKQGWIELKYLGINPAIYSGMMMLRTEPKATAPIMNIINNPWWGSLYNIYDCTNQWLYIRTIVDGKVVEGWMAPEDQCCNPYSTCN